MGNALFFFNDLWLASLFVRCFSSDHGPTHFTAAARVLVVLVVIVLLLQDTGDQGKAYRLITELEHNLIRGSKRDRSNAEKPEVRGCREDA